MSTETSEKAIRNGAGVELVVDAIAPQLDRGGSLRSSAFESMVKRKARTILVMFANHVVMDVKHEYNHLECYRIMIMLK